MLSYGSVCSGIEAASVAWHPLGWQPAWFAEVDRAASEVLAYRFPDVPNHGDMTLLAGKVRCREIPAPDVLVGGTPCQGLSVAGLRGGMDDGRTQLTLHFIDLANAIDEVRHEDGLEPVIVVWENVPGALNIHDNSFGIFLAGLAGDDEALEPGPRPESARSSAYWTWDKKAGVHRPKWPVAGAVAGPQRAAAWRVLDAQYFRLAQRRRRVFVVASARQGFDPAAILLEFDGVRRDSAPSRETGEGSPGAAETGAGSGCGEDRGRLRGAAGLTEAAPVPTWWDGRQVSQTLDAVLHKGQTMPEKNRFPAVLQPVAYAARGHLAGFSEVTCGDPIRAHGGDAGPGSENIIAFTTKDYGGDASVGVSPTLRSMGHDGSHANGGGQVGIAYAIQERAICENPAAGPDADAVRADNCAYTLEARSVPQAVAVLPFDTTQITHPANRSSPREGDPCHPLAAGAHPPAVCVTGSVTHTLKAEGFDASEDGTGRGQPIVPAFTYTMAVRRLMPVECERLQGFPDNWTLVPTGKSGKPAADGPRYKQCGNSMATHVMHWIGSRIDRAVRPNGHNGGPPLDDFSELLG